MVNNHIRSNTLHGIRIFYSASPWKLI
ncbi:hypothetical protein [Vibrio nigripulchritudo]